MLKSFTKARSLHGMRVLACVAMAFGAGCDEDQPRPLTAADVTGLPAGTGFGTGFSGQYLSTSWRVLSCTCPADQCPVSSDDLGSVSLTAMQTDGVLALDIGCTGGVDAGGRFWCGAAGETTTATVYSLLNGRFVLAGIQVMGMTFTLRQTMVPLLTGSECDLSIRASMAYFGP